MIPYSLQVPPQARALTPFRPRRYVCMCCQAPHKPTGLQVLCVGCITCIWCSLALVCSLGAISGIWPWFAVGAGRLRGLRFAVQSATGLQFAVYGDMGQFSSFLGDLASRPTPEPSAVVQRNSTSSEHVLDFLRASGLVASSRSGARCARTWAPSAVQIATPPPLLFVHGSPGCAGGGRMPVGDSNALTTRR